MAQEAILGIIVLFPQDGMVVTTEFISQEDITILEIIMGSRSESMIEFMELNLEDLLS